MKGSLLREKCLLTSITLGTASAHLCWVMATLLFEELTSCHSTVMATISNDSIRF
jgi:hypothetical protein